MAAMGPDQPSGPGMMAGLPGHGAEGGDVTSQGSTLRLLGRTFAQNRLGLVGGAIIVGFVLFCYVGPLVYHTNQVVVNPGMANLSPRAGHLLGTDSQGFDVLGRLMKGGQSSLEVGIAVAICATLLGSLYGAIAGMIGGAVDAVMMRIVDGLYAIPTLFVLLILADMVTLNLPVLILVLSVLSWLGPSRLVRGETLSLRTREFVEVVRISGGTSWRMVVRHIMPNTIGTIVVNASFQVADAILALATLTFLGLGLPPPAVSWGAMLSNGIDYLYDGYWWEVYFAGAAIVLVVIAFNFVGDALRDSLDVRLRRR